MRFYEDKLVRTAQGRVEGIRDQTLEPFARYTLAELATERLAKINYAVAACWRRRRSILDNPTG